MRPTLALGQNVVVDKDAYRSSPPSIGDVVLFYGPLDTTPAEIHDPLTRAACAHPRPGPASDTYIKRIVAGENDVISIARGFVIRNGVAESPSHIIAGDELLDRDFLTPIVIPTGTWYLLGDNRAQSTDSRYWGPIPTDWIIAKVDLATRS